MHDLYVKSLVSSLPRVLSFSKCERSSLGEWNFVTSKKCRQVTSFHDIFVTMPRRITPTGDDRSRAITLLSLGYTQREVARRLRVSQSVISRLKLRHQLIGSVDERPRSGRPRCTRAAQDRHIVLQAKRQRLKSAVELNAEFIRTHRIRMSAQTYRNRLHDANLRAQKPAVHPPLSRQHIRRRPQFSRNHSNIQLLHLRPILFTDESKFFVDCHDGRRNVLREKNETYRDCCVVEHNWFGGGSVMALVGISVDGATELFFIPNGTITAARYRDEILHCVSACRCRWSRICAYGW